MTTGKRKRHTADQIFRKLRDADAMLNAGRDLAAVIQALEVSFISHLIMLGIAGEIMDFCLD